MNCITKFQITFFCKNIGIDSFGNKYYEQKNISKKKRFVIYNGTEEASKIPAQWHRWLHYSGDEIPSESGDVKNAWQKSHLPNLTGTKFLYSPEQYKDHYNRKHYEIWSPK